MKNHPLINYKVLKVFICLIFYIFISIILIKHKKLKLFDTEKSQIENIYLL